MDLRLDDIDAGHLFGNRVLDLNARVDLDEIEFAAIGVHQELDGTSADIVGGMGDLQTIIRKLLTLSVVEIRRWCPLHDFLVASLDRAVTLEKMNRIALAITQYLHFDMARAFNELFEINFILAECSLGLALGFRHFASEISLGADGAHTATATAPARLQHQRIADFCRKLLHFLHIVRKRVSGRNHRHADFNGKIAGRNLVAEAAHGLRLRTDEDDIVLGTSLGKFRAFRQSP